MKSNLTKHEKECLDNRIVFVSSAIFLYAMLLVFIQRMSTDPITVNGALAFIKILKYVALVGAMGCAAWSAYKEKKGFFIYCIMCMFVFLSTTVLQFSTQKGSNSPYIINYAALAVTFILTYVFYGLKVRGALDKKNVRVLFTTVCIIAAAGIALISVININSIFLPEAIVALQSKILGIF